MDNITDIRTTLFTGRSAFFSVLHATLQANRCAVISGPIGSGKTALAHEYARRFATHYQEIHGMQVATNEMQLITSIELARILDLPLRPGQKLASAFPLLKNWLATRQNYLFILDNINDPAFLETLLPPDKTGFVLLLTTLPMLHPPLPILELEGLEVEESAQLLLHQSGQHFPTSLEQTAEKQRQDALELARALDGLPLALKLAKSFIRETGCDMPTYLQLYRAERQHLSEEIKTQGDFAATLRVAYRLALRSLEEKNPLAANILGFCALLAPDMILDALFTQGLANSYEAFQELARDPLAFAQVRATLLAYGLCEHQGGPLMFRVPPLVQSILLKEMTQAERHQRATQLLYALHQMMPSSYDEVPAQYHLCYLGHIRQVATHGEQLTFLFKEAAEVFSWAAGILSAQENFRESAEFLKKALAVRELTSGSNVLTLTAMQHNLAALYEYLDDYAEAESLLHKAIAARAQALGALHADTIASLHNLGVVYARQDKWEAAEAVYQKALSLCQAGRNLEHPLALITQIDLAIVYLAREQWELAEPLLQHANSLAAQILGPEHAQTLRVQQALAIVYVALQRWKAAEPLLVSINALYEHSHGIEQDDTLNVLQLLALIYAMQEKWQEAEQLLLHNSAWQTRPLDGHEFETTRILHLLALISMGQERWEAAITFLQSAIGLYERMPEEMRPDLTECYGHLLLLHIQQGNMLEAEAVMRSIQALMEAKIDGPDTGETVTALSQLALLYISQMRLEEAERLLKRVVEISQRMPELEPPLLSAERGLLAGIRAAEQRNG